MNIFLQYFFIIITICYLFILACVYYFLYKTFYSHLNFLKNIKPEDVEPKYFPFHRYEYDKWPKLEMFLMVPLFPIKVISLISYTLIINVTVQFLCLIHVPNWILKLAIKYPSRICLMLCGFFWIQKESVKIQDFDNEYQDPEGITKDDAPIVIGNHQSGFDILLMLQTSFTPGFLAKAAVAKLPIIGTFAKILKSLFLQRGSEKDRELIKSQIKERINQYNSGQEKGKLMIFPEGTTSNGKQLISFKQGAFMCENRVKILCFKYLCDNFQPYNDALPEYYGYILGFLKLYNSVKIIEFEMPFDPSYLKKKYSDSYTWELYAKKVRSVMAKCLKISEVDYSFRDSQEYSKIMREKINQERVNYHKREPLKTKID